MIEWHMQGIQFGSCNCDHACPCQFEGLPNYGNCQGFDVFRVEKGEFDGVDLAGVVVAAADDRLRIATGGGGLDLCRLQPAGKRVLTAEQFLRGYQLQVGDRLQADG